VEGSREREMMGKAREMDTFGGCKGSYNYKRV
jgi:hypothetical protein